MSTEKPADFPHLRKVTIFEECAAEANAEAEYCERQGKAFPHEKALWVFGACAARIIRNRIQLLAKAASTPPWEETERPQDHTEVTK